MGTTDGGDEQEHELPSLDEVKTLNWVETSFKNQEGLDKIRQFVST